MVPERRSGTGKSKGQSKPISFGANGYTAHFLDPMLITTILIFLHPGKAEISWHHMYQCKMRFFFPHGDIWTTKWALCVCGTRERCVFFFSDHKMNESAEEFHGLCVCSSMCDLEDYWSRLGTATVLPPRGSANKTQSLGKIIVRKHQNIPPCASISLALKDFHLPQRCRALLKKSMGRLRGSIG